MKINQLLIGYLGLTCMVLASCGGSVDIKSADEAYRQLEYAHATDLYKSVFDKAKEEELKNKSALGAGNASYQIGKYKESLDWFKKAKGSVAEEGKIGQAQALLALGEYDRAQALLKTLKQDAETSRLLASANLGIESRNKISKYDVAQLAGINSAAAEYGPAFSKDGQTLYFTSDRQDGGEEVFRATNRSFSDLYQVKASQLQQKSARISFVSGDVNTDMNEGSGFVDQVSGNLFYTQCNGEDAKGKTCKIFIGAPASGSWSLTDSVPFNSESYSVAHPFVSEDGQTLYFSSNMPGGFGGKDLYKSTYNKQTSKWGEPQNLGAAVNTKGDEVFPSVYSNKGQTYLYFSSDEHPGFGSLDILVSTQQGNDWSAPVNVGAPINSGGDDFGVIWEKGLNKGYFTSNRTGGKGGDDIYEIFLRPVEIVLRGVVTNEVTGEVIKNARINYYINDTMQVPVQTNERGEYQINRLRSNSVLKLTSSKTEDYFLDSREEQVSTRGIDSSVVLVQHFKLKALDLNAEFTLEGILYDVNKADITPASALILDSLALLLKKFPKVQIELGSHTDCRSDASYNEALSQRRAQSAVDYLKSKGIEGGRMTAKGYGESLPVNNCRCEGDVPSTCTEEEHKLNRRTTFKVLSTNYEKK